MKATSAKISIIPLQNRTSCAATTPSDHLQLFQFTRHSSPTILQVDLSSHQPVFGALHVQQHLWPKPHSAINCTLPQSSGFRWSSGGQLKDERILMDIRFVKDRPCAASSSTSAYPWDCGLKSCWGKFNYLPSPWDHRKTQSWPKAFDSMDKIRHLKDQ